VFIRQFVLPDRHDAYLFGVRFDLNKAAIRGRTLPEGYFLEYLVLDSAGTGQTIYRLRQHRTPTYSAKASGKDYIRANDLAEEQIAELLLNDPPRWKVEDAVWPNLDGRLMFFVGQAALVENEVTRRFLVWDKAVFLFWARESLGVAFKIVAQDIDYESAEEHYAHE
jgi:hypothetical protein